MSCVLCSIKPVDNLWTLSCGHSFCLPCLQRSFPSFDSTTPTLECPICKRVHVFRPQFGPLPITYNNAVTPARVSPAAQLSPGPISSPRSGRSSLPSGPAAVPPLSDISDPSFKIWQNASIFCQHHPNEKLQFWCVTDNSVICCRCLQTPAHHGHQLQTVRERLATLYKELHESRQLMQQYFDTILRDLHKQQRIIHQQSIQIEQHIKTAFQQLELLVKAKYEQFMDFLKSKTETQLKATNSLLFEVKTMQSVVEEHTKLTASLQNPHVSDEERLQAFLQYQQFPINVSSLMRQLQEAAERYKLKSKLNQIREDETENVVVAPLGLDPNKFISATFDLSDVIEKLDEKCLTLQEVKIPSSLFDIPNMARPTERQVGVIGSPHSTSHALANGQPQASPSRTPSQNVSSPPALHRLSSSVSDGSLSTAANVLPSIPSPRTMALNHSAPFERLGIGSPTAYGGYPPAPQQPSSVHSAPDIHVAPPSASAIAEQDDPSHLSESLDASQKTRPRGASWAEIISRHSPGRPRRAASDVPQPPRYLQEQQYPRYYQMARAHNNYYYLNENDEVPVTWSNKYTKKSNFQSSIKSKQKTKTLSIFEPEADLARSLYLRNLPSTVTELDIKLAFAKFGKVQKVTLLADHGYGFVYFYSPESIPLVMRHIATNPIVIDNKPIRIEERKPFGPGEDRACSLFVANFPMSVTEERLRQIFSKYGKVKDVAIKQGYGFVDFESQEEAQRVFDVASAEEIVIDGKVLKIERRIADGQEHVEPSDGLDKFRSIFVGNLPDDAHEAAVEQLFSKFGAVLDVAVKQGYGFVDFASPEDAQSVLDALARGEQLYLDGRKLNIEPRKREPPEFTRVNRAAKLKKIAKQQQQQQQPQQQKQQSEQQQQKQQQQQQQKQQQQPEQPQPQQPSQQQQQQQQKQKQQQQQQHEQPQSTPQP